MSFSLVDFVELLTTFGNQQQQFSTTTTITLLNKSYEKIVLSNYDIYN